MHKITKGLKKKKKGKKSKHKEDELFKPEELEAYRREHQQPVLESCGEQAGAGSVASGGGGDKPAAGGENEEWRKFLALTSGVDDILKKTQGDLDRIKSTSFFQRVPPPSEIKRREDAIRLVEEKEQEEERRLQQEIAKVEAAIVQVSDSESGEDADEDDIFDTGYIDAIATGEVKLAYIPDSPTDPIDGDDPFDTSIADKAILGPQSDRKGKRLIPLGSAVEILSGRVQAPTCASIKRPSPKRQIISQQQNLLGSFENTTTDLPVTASFVAAVDEPKPHSLLDEDAPEGLANEEIDLSKSLFLEQQVASEFNPLTDIVQEFDGIVNPPEDEDDLEFAQLAAESLTKAPVNVITVLQQEPIVPEKKEDWNAAFEKQEGDIYEEEVDADPFDTTFAENILPGQAELKQIEKEILDSDDNFEFNPRANEKYNEILQSAVTIQLTNPTGDRESISSIDRVNAEDLTTIRPIHRDLLGGSSTDLSQLAEQPLKPNEQSEEESIEYSDPFDTSIVDVVALPGQTELKFLERELLADVHNKPQPLVITRSLSDEDFDPRQGEEIKKPETSLSAIQARKVSFDLPLAKSDLLSLDADDQSKNTKPLTPYYVRDNSIPEDFIDPFDTEFVGKIGPGKTELKLLEDELINKDLKHSISDSDFNPRDDHQVNIAKVVQAINKIPDPTVTTKPIDLVFQEEEKVDLLSVTENINTKVLTPQDTNQESDDIDVDPFDTSIASNILPGQVELKLLETELSNIHSVQVKRVLTDPDFDPRDITDITLKPVPTDLLEPSNDFVSAKPLTPLTGRVSFSIGEDDDDIDPFDTSIANNLGPGELKALESELI